MDSDRAGLVGTNSISQGKSRIASLDHVVRNGGYIHEAISTQPWSGEANVHVSIVNWKRDIPNILHLDNEPVAKISSSLKSSTDVSQSYRLKSNLGASFQGVIPVGKGFYISTEEAKLWISDSDKNREVLKWSSSAGDLTDNPDGQPERWIIDFNDMSIEEADVYHSPLAHLKEVVKPKRDKNRRDSTRINWWKHGEKRPALREAISDLDCFFTIPRHSKWFVFLPVPSSRLPADSTTVVSSEDF